LYIYIIPLHFPAHLSGNDWAFVFNTHKETNKRMQIWNFIKKDLLLQNTQFYLENIKAFLLRKKIIHKILTAVISNRFSSNFSLNMK